MAVGDSGQAGELADVEITPQMIEAGVLAAELEGYEYGYGEEEALVTRVYLAMRTAALFPTSAT